MQKISATSFHLKKIFTIAERKQNDLEKNPVYW